MDIINLKQWLENSVTEVLESMCFLFPEAVAEPETSIAIEPNWLSSRLSFSGTPCGSFGLCAPLICARAIAANFLGEEMDDVNDAQAAEVIAEMANMVCGSLLGRYEPNRSFNLSSPTFGSMNPSQVIAPGYFSRVFALDEGVLHAWIEIGISS
jgi:CheY-specific phosphatase CheX